MILETLEGKKRGRAPVWFMRQAGRYMASYRALKEKYSFLEMCMTPEIAAQVTMMPVEKFGFDAAILFSDILIPAAAMGLKLEYSPGPAITPAVTELSIVDGLKIPAAEEYGFIQKAIAIISGKLPAGKDLIGFAGAPFTIAAYLVQGGSKGDFSGIKKMAGTPLYHLLMEKITLAVMEYARAQAMAGIKVFQFFDTWAAILGAGQYSRDIGPYTQRVVDAAKSYGMKVIYFFKGEGEMARAVSALINIDALSVDSAHTLAEFDAFTGKKFILQGNLAPEILLKDHGAIKKGIDDILMAAAGLKGHIFNLGHGVLKETPEENVAFAVDYIKKAEKK
jgi:uroporphyrinogen decarboxylase